MSAAPTIDPHPTVCDVCGTPAHLTRRGPVALLPRGHRAPDGGTCLALEWQTSVLHTARRLADAGVPMTAAELAEMLRWTKADLDQLAERYEHDDAHVRTWERGLLEAFGFEPLGRHGWVSRHGTGPTMSPGDAVARIRAGQFGPPPTREG